MTKKDYELIARCIKDARDSVLSDSEMGILNFLITELVAELAAENEGFDRQKFYKACGWG
jgi:hypothetical protein